MSRKEESLQPNRTHNLLLWAWRTSGQARSDRGRLQWSANHKAARERLGTRRFVRASFDAGDEAAQAFDIIEPPILGMRPSVFATQDTETGSPDTPNVAFSSSCELGCTPALRGRIDDQETPLGEALTDWFYSKRIAPYRLSSKASSVMSTIRKLPFPTEITSDDVARPLPMSMQLSTLYIFGSIL